MVQNSSLDPRDLMVQVYRSGVNCPVHVKIWHEPTGHTAEAEGKSQRRATEEATKRLAEQIKVQQGIRAWNALDDPYDHTQLAENFSRIDPHDMRLPTLSPRFQLRVSGNCPRCHADRKHTKLRLRQWASRGYGLPDSEIRPYLNGLHCVKGWCPEHGWQK